jgi:ABC-type dipeptide/oligopeptide/nickel transport system permease subunit
MINGTHLAALYIGIIIGMIAGVIYGWMIRDERK